MRTKNQYSLNAFRALQSLGRENAGKLGPAADSESRYRLDAAIERLEAHGLTQTTSVMEMKGLVSLQQSLEVDLQKGHLQPIATFARVRLRTAPESAALTRGTSELFGPKLVRAARVLAEAAEPHREAFVRNGFPPTFLEELIAAADKLDATIVKRGALKGRRAAATTGVAEETKEAHAAVMGWSAVVERHLAADEAFLAAWRSARRVRRS